MPENVEIALKGLFVEIYTLKSILMRAHKENKRAKEKSSIFLENRYSIMNRILVEIWILKVIVVRS